VAPNHAGTLPQSKPSHPLVIASSLALIGSFGHLVAANAYRRNILDREREQASKIAAWVTLKDESGNQSRLLRVRNSSDAPVYDLIVTVADCPVTTLPELLPETTWTHDLGKIGEIPDRLRVRKISVELAYLVSVGLSRETVLTEPWPSMQFRDAVGRWWERDSSGQLTHLRSRNLVRIYGLNLSGLRLSWGEGERLIRYDSNRLLELLFSKIWRSRASRIDLRPTLLKIVELMALVASDPRDARWTERYLQPVLTKLAKQTDMLKVGNSEHELGSIVLISSYIQVVMAIAISVSICRDQLGKPENLARLYMAQVAAAKEVQINCHEILQSKSP
jgi:hypothetical protein